MILSIDFSEFLNVLLLYLLYLIVQTVYSVYFVIKTRTIRQKCASFYNKTDDSGLGYVCSKDLIGLSSRGRSHAVARVAAHKAPWAALPPGSPNADERKGPTPDNPTNSCLQTPVPS